MSTTFFTNYFFPKDELFGKEKEATLFKDVCFFLVRNGLQLGDSVNKDQSQEGMISYLLHNARSQAAPFEEAINKIQGAGGGCLDFTDSEMNVWISLALADGFNIYSHSSSLALVSLFAPGACIWKAEKNQALKAANRMVALAEMIHSKFHPIWSCGELIPESRLPDIFGNPPETPEFIERIRRFNFFFWLNIYSPELLKDEYAKKLEQNIDKIEKEVPPGRGREFKKLEDGSVLFRTNDDPRNYSDKYLANRSKNF